MGLGNQFALGFEIFQKLRGFAIFIGPLGICLFDRSSEGAA
jgi:hypothetical protein